MDSEGVPDSMCFSPGDYFQGNETLEEVFNRLAITGFPDRSPEEERAAGNMTTDGKRWPKLLGPPTTEAGQIKEQSKILEEGLRDILKMVEDGQPISIILKTTVETFQKQIAAMAHFLCPKPRKSRKPSTKATHPFHEIFHEAVHDIRPTAGQKRRLISLHGAYLTLIFHLLSEQLFRAENTADAQSQGLQELQSGLDLAIKTFDTNWRKLRCDHRVQGEPAIPKKPITERPDDPPEGQADMWCAVAQARALLALAQARAALTASEAGIDGCEVNGLPGEHHTSLGGSEEDHASLNGSEDAHTSLSSSDGYRTKASIGVTKAREHLAEAKALANWTWWHRQRCSKKARDAVVTWQDRFWPIYGLIEDGICYAGRGDNPKDWDPLHEPVFKGPAQVMVRWDYQFTDVNVAYEYETLVSEDK